MNKILQQDVLKAIKYLNDNNITSYFKAILFFLRGNKNSVRYENVYTKYLDICGKYPKLTFASLNGCLNELIESNILKTNLSQGGKVFYVLKIKNEPQTFYESCSKEEQEILDEFYKLIKELLPDHDLDNTKPYIYPFVPKVATTIYKNRVWISKDKKTKILKLHYKKVPGKVESEPILLKNRKVVDEAWRILRITYSKDKDDILEITNKIKSGDTFDEYQSNNLILDKISLMPHQKAGVKLSLKYDRFAFFYDTGTGKTIMALDIMEEKRIKNNARFLVVAPKPLIKSAWMDDAKYFKNMKLLPLSNNMTSEEYARIYDEWLLQEGKERLFTDEEGNLLEKVPTILKEDLVNELIEKANHFIINIDVIREPKKGEGLLKKINVNGLIIDESVIIKNYLSANARRMRVFARQMKYVYLLSGKPAPNTTIDYYSQMVIVDPKTFNIPYYTFINKYFKKVGISKYVDKNDKTKETVAKMVSSRAIFIKKEECLNLPSTFHRKIEVEIDDETLRFYEDVLSNYISTITTMDGKKLLVKKMPRLASITKLREIASGFYLDKYDSYKLNPYKVKAVIDLINEIGYQDENKPNQILIWCSFKYEIKVLEKELTKLGYKVVTAYSETRNLDQNINDFKYGKADIMIAHPQTLKYGVTFTSCHYAIFSSMSYSYDDYYQAHDRIYRKGQENTCFFYHLLTENTIDEIIYKCVEEKENTSKLFERLVKSASKHKFNKETILKVLKSSNEIKEVAVRE